MKQNVTRTHLGASSCTMPPVKRTAGALLAGAALVLFWNAGGTSLGFEQYRDPDTLSGNCSACHGAFTDTTSPKGTGLPASGGKHTMHRSSSYMNTDCNLCHTSGDNRNPFLGSSDGIPGQVPGLGCSGCHNGPGLRRHHAANGIADCAGCHVNDDPLAIPPENVEPPYYAVAYPLGYTRAHNAGNPVAVANTNENWSIGDFLGLDNDGNNIYDRLDPAVTPYRIRSIKLEGKDVRITWDTTGGRTDVVQTASAVTGPYSDVSAPIGIPGSAVVTTNVVHLGGATNTPAYFYRLRLVP